MNEAGVDLSVVLAISFKGGVDKSRKRNDILASICKAEKRILGFDYDKYLSRMLIICSSSIISYIGSRLDRMTNVTFLSGKNHSDYSFFPL